jgi:transposase
MEKNLPLELDREILIQLAPEQLVEIIVFQASATIKLNSRILELEQEIGKLKASRDLDGTYPTHSIARGFKPRVRGLWG